MYLVGGAVGFYSGDITRLADDLKTLKPTVTPAVPRLLNRIYDKVMVEVNSSFIKKMLFNMGLNSKHKELARFV